MSLRVSMANLLEPLRPVAQSGRWFNAYTRSGSNTWSFATNPGVADLTPIMFDAPVVITSAACNVTTGQAATTGAIGIYASDGNGLPSGLAVSYGGLSFASTGVKTPVVSSAIRLGAGLYWVGVFSAATTAVLRALAPDNAEAARLFGYALNTDAAAVGTAFRVTATTPPARINPSALTVATGNPPYAAIRVA